MLVPPERPTYTTERPSGETATGAYVASSRRSVPDIDRVNRTGAGVGAEGRRHHPHTAATRAGIAMAGRTTRLSRAPRVPGRNSGGVAWTEAGLTVSPGSS